ncbi:MAG: CBS domain-containing protein [Candidatus Helarchaeota archaeon]
MTLSELKARDVMVTEPIAVHPSEQIAAVDLLMSRNNLGGIPVIDNSRLIGIITLRDIMLSRFSICVNGMKVEDLMMKNPVSVSPDTLIKEVLSLIIKYQLEQLPVTENGEVVGLITKENLLKKFSENI